MEQLPTHSSLPMPAVFYRRRDRAPTEEPRVDGGDTTGGDRGFFPPARLIG